MPTTIQPITELYGRLTQKMFVTYSINFINRCNILLSLNLAILRIAFRFQIPLQPKAAQPSRVARNNKNYIFNIDSDISTSTIIKLITRLYDRLTQKSS